MSIYNAIESDRHLQTLMDFNPNITPAYLTALLEDNTHNHMYPLILNVRNFLQDYIHKYRTRFKTQFSLTDFDWKFLKNPHLKDIAYFFVYNLLYLFSLRSYTSIELIQNDFSRLKALDVFFNLCLIIDETLKVAYRKTKGTIKNSHYISESFIWLVESNKWMAKKGDLQNLWGKNHLNVNDAHPDVIIPKLLEKSELYEGKGIRNEIFSLLLVYKLRNYGGHNIQQPKVFTENYLAIIEELFMALFLSVRVL
jgi:hypothetical protein